MKRWRKRQPGRSIAQDLEVRGRRDALDLLSIGTGAAIDRCCILWLADEEGAQPSICVGSRAYVGPFCYLGSHQSLTIGEDTIIGGFSYLITGNHRFDRKDIPVRDQGYTGAPIALGSNVWLGCHVVVLPGVTIGDGAVIGAGVVVTKNVPGDEIWGGVPARGGAGIASMRLVEALCEHNIDAILTGITPSAAHPATSGIQYSRRLSERIWRRFRKGQVERIQGGVTGDPPGWKRRFGNLGKQKATNLP